MKTRQKKKDLFTVDTVGDQNDSDNEIEDSEILYPVDGTENSGDSENSDDEEVEEEEEEEEDTEEKETENDDEPMEDNEDKDDEEEEEYDYGGLPPPSVDIISILKNPVLARRPLYGNDEETPKPTVESDLDAFCKAMGWTEENGYLPRKPADKQTKKRWKNREIDLTDVHKDFTKTNVEKEMSKCILNGIETKKDVKIPSQREAHRQRKAEASKTKGKNWFDIPATEVTEELRQDMEIIQMRSALNPTHFYKKNDLKTLPKYFQVGTVLPSPLERYNDRGERVTKKKSLVDELLQDAEFQRFNKRKYKEVMAEKRVTGYKKAYKKMKKLKKKS